MNQQPKPIDDAAMREGLSMALPDQTDMRRLHKVFTATYTALECVNEEYAIGGLASGLGNYQIPGAGDMIDAALRAITCLAVEVNAIRQGILEASQLHAQYRASGQDEDQ